MSSDTVKYVGENGKGTVADVLRARAELTPDATFVSFDGTVVTYAGMVDRAERAAGALAGLGMVPGDRVATVLPNSLELLDVWIGAAVGGFVLVPVNTGLKGEGLRYILEHSESKVVVVDGPLAGTLATALPVDVGPRIRLTRGVKGPEGLTAADVLAAGPPDGRPAHPAVDSAGLATILYTSGTTGLPKGVMNGHRPYLTAGVEFTRKFLRVGTDDVLYTTLPLFHVNAQMLSVMGAIVSGRPLVLAPKFSASRFFDEIRAHQATVFNYIGAMLTMLYKQPIKQQDAMNPVRLAVGGAAPKELWRDFETRFGLEILEIYGLTETACFCLGSPPDAIKPGKLGKAVSWAEVEVQDENGVTSLDGEPGEIVVRPKQEDTLFRGYLKNDEATAKAMRQGWFLTGDRGFRDDDGYFVFLDRMKDVIRRRGENISSYEVERAANLHDDVAESAAVGVPSDLGEEEVMIVVVPREGREIEPATIRAHCAEQLAAFMVPRYVLVRDALPKTATQRVQKFELRKGGFAGAWDHEAATPRRERETSDRADAVAAAAGVGRFGHDAEKRSAQWSTRGTVIHGDRRGRELGFPTANLRLGDREAPPFGVYAARLDGRPAAVSVGVRPTFGEGLEPLVEAHVLDFSGDLYGQEVVVELFERIRSEERFDDVDALVRRMHRDVEEVRRLEELAPTAPARRA